MTLKRVGDLDVAEDLPHQEMVWRVQRGGWLVMAVLLLAALFGLLGPGPLSSATAGDRRSSISVDYARFVRYQAPCQFRIHLSPTAERNGKVRLWLSREFISRAQVEHIDPPPERTELHPERFVYVIDAPQLEKGATATIHFQPDSYGRLAVALGIDRGAEVRFDQWVYP